MALLENWDLRLPDEAREAWTDRVARERDYGNLISVGGKEDALDKTGLLKIRWPRAVSGQPLEWNAVLATVNSPRGSRYGYPPARKIAEAWSTPEGRGEEGYFWNNRKNKIWTHQDAEIEARLRELDAAS